MQRMAIKTKRIFIKGLKEELKGKHIPFTELKGEAITPESLKGAMNATLDNVFIPTSGTNIALIKLLPQLIVTLRDNPDYRMQLFGYPEWQTYTNDHLASFYELDTYFYSSFYTNNYFPKLSDSLLPIANGTARICRTHSPNMEC